MAIVAEKQDTKDSITHLHKFIQKYDTRGAFLADLLKDFKEFRTHIVMLVNAEADIKRRLEEANDKVAKAERQAQDRLATIEMGQRALIERLNKKEMELNKLRDDVEARERLAAQKLDRYEALTADLERKIAGVDQVKAAKK